MPSVSTGDQARRSNARGAWLVPAILGCAFVGYWSLPSIRALSGPTDRSTHAAVAIMRSASRPGQVMLAPPFYLYLAGRVAYGDYADVNLWAERAQRGDAPAVALAAAATRAIRARAFPLVLVDGRVRRLPGVPAALQAAYRRLPFQDAAPIDRAIEIWVPGR